MDNRSKRNHMATDIISNLPCNVIDDILKYLPLRDAVRTSVLSKGWRYTWLTTPYLVFDKNFKNHLPDSYNIESIIYQVLLLHKGPILKFEYDVHDVKSHAPVDHWLHFLSNHRIKELTLWFPNSDLHQRMPHHLFSFNQLRDLHLANCELRPPSEFHGFDRLNRLDLYNVLIESRELRRFISKCPMLGHLGLYGIDCNTLENLQIDAPNLKSLWFFFWDGIPSICVANTLLLEEVSIRFSGNILLTQGTQSNLIKFFGQLPFIKKLELGCDSLLGWCGSLAGKLRHLMVLQLDEIAFNEVHEASSVVCLIRSFPNLRSLAITSCVFSDGDAKPAVEFLKEQHNNLSLCLLEHVKIDSFSALEPEMEFVKLILSTAPALVKLELELQPDLRDADKGESRMLKELARFCRASPKAQIFILEY